MGYGACSSATRAFSVLFFTNSIGDDKSTDRPQGAKEYDTVIVGGGMVGVVVGCGLASMPLTKALQVAIIDSSPTLGVRKHLPKDGAPYPRVSAITPTTISLFRDVGAWEYVQACRHAPLKEIQVWDYTSLGYTRYNAADVGKPVLGYVVENKVLHDALLTRLQDTGFAEIICLARVKSVSFKANSRSVEDSRSPGEPKNNKTSSSFQEHEGPSDSIFPYYLAKVEPNDGIGDWS